MIIIYYSILLLFPSFYHSLGYFLTTLGMHAHVEDPRYHSTWYSTGYK